MYIYIYIYICDTPGCMCADCSLAAQSDSMLKGLFGICVTCLAIIGLQLIFLITSDALTNLHNDGNDKLTRKTKKKTNKNQTNSTFQKHRFKSIVQKCTEIIKKNVQKIMLKNFQNNTPKSYKIMTKKY